jgi:hypothetical protein
MNKPVHHVAFCWPTTGKHFPVSNKEGSPLGNYAYPARCFEGATPRHVPVDMHHNFDIPLTAELWYDDSAVYGRTNFPDLQTAISIRGSFNGGEFKAVSPEMNVIRSHLEEIDGGGTFIVGDKVEITAIALVGCSANTSMDCRAWIQHYDFRKPEGISYSLFDSYRETFFSDVIRSGYVDSLFIRQG